MLLWRQFTVVGMADSSRLPVTFCSLWLLLVMFDYFIRTLWGSCLHRNSSRGREKNGESQDQEFLLPCRKCKSIDCTVNSYILTIHISSLLQTLEQPKSVPPLLVCLEGHLYCDSMFTLKNK